MKRLLIVLICMVVAKVVVAQQFYEETPQAKRWVDSVYKSLSKEQRIGQLMVVRLSAKTTDGWQFFDKKVEEEIRKYNIGSICLFQGNPVEQARFVNYFQSIARTPLMISIDGEMGVGMRMYDSVMKFPDQLTLGAVNDASLIYKIGRAMGAQCKRAGIHIDYAPVVDINNNPDNPVIGYRSFGEDRYKVARYGIQIMRGLQDMGVMACAKHFPGHGDVSVDSHYDLPVINKSLAQLDTLELYPFKELFKAGVGSVMNAHLSIPALDTTTHLPTSLSKNSITVLLREQLGFKGISFTDALEMQGVAKYYPGSKGGIQSLLAGNDMLCLPGDVPGTIKGVLEAVKKNKLDKADLEQRVKKVLLVKYHMGLSNQQPVELNNLTIDLNADVPALRAAVAEEALTVVQMTHPALLPLQQTNSVAYVAVGLQQGGTLAGLLKENYKADVFYFDYKADASKAAAIIDAVKKKYDRVIIGVHGLSRYPSNNFGFSNAAVQLVAQLQQVKPAVTLVFGNPYSIKNVCSAPNLVLCYEDDAIFQKAAYNWLNGRFTAKGTLPVSVCQFRYGSGVVKNSTELPFALPEDAGLNSARLNTITDSIMHAAIAQQAMPGGVVLVARHGKLVFNRAYGNFTYDSAGAPVLAETVYDLASVTKISATTVAVMKLYEEGLLDVKKKLGDYLPWVRGTDKANLSIEDILLHQAGLVPYIPFYKETIDTITGIPLPGYFQDNADDRYSVPVAVNMFMRSDWRDTMMARILQSPLTPRGKYVYSDNDFIFLGKIVEQITGKLLNQYVKESFYDPLQMRSTTFNAATTLPLQQVAPTEQEKYFRLQQLQGYVHDPGAAMFGGVAGHAGLFSNAYDLAKLYQVLLNGGEWNGRRFFRKETIDYFSSYQSDSSRRGLGFDKPEKNNATRKDPYPAKSASPQTYGHTGFTGTCVWVDPAQDIIFIFLSNRVNPMGGDNKKLIELGVRNAILENIYQSIIQ